MGKILDRYLTGRGICQSGRLGFDGFNYFELYRTKVPDSGEKRANRAIMFRFQSKPTALSANR
ncbi:MAG: hypothetical protein DYG98_11860 [Haliscomenobacteraceae bacterium CHB4]|nr:hypothetical protein [Haliscomenobacteraceae bacterium CHB4]